MALQAWVGRTGGQLDADSPLDITLHNSYDDDLIHLRQVLYGDGIGGFLTPIDGHHHDGVDSKFVSFNRVSDSTSYVIPAASAWYPNLAMAWAPTQQAGINFEVFLNAAWSDESTPNAPLFSYTSGGHIRFDNTTGGGLTYHYVDLINQI